MDILFHLPGPLQCKHCLGKNIRSAQNIGKVWISREKFSWPYLGPSQAIFSIPRKNRKMLKFCLFSLVGQWALFTRCGPLLLSPRGGEIGLRRMIATCFIGIFLQPTLVQLWIHCHALQFVTTAFLLSPLCIIVIIAVDKLADRHCPCMAFLSERTAKMENICETNVGNGAQMGPGKFFPTAG